MTTQWLHATTTVPTVSLISLAGWAAFATALAAWLHRRCYRWHYGAADVQPVKWSEPTPATVAEPGRDTEKAAS